MRVWGKVLKGLETQLNSVSFDVWVKNLEPFCISKNKLVLVARTEQIRSTVNNNYKGIIEECIREAEGRATGSECKSPNSLEGIEIILESEKSDFVLNSEADIKPVEPSPSSLPNPTVNMFDKRYTFASFVVGKSNEIAHGASRGVAKAPGKHHNPLYIWGSTGLGKTHLLHAIGNEIKQTTPKLNVLCVRCDTMVSEIVDYMQNPKKSKDFKKKYRNVDVLIVDDIQFISGKERTQEEFFNIFNDLYHAGKQIIISSDKRPKEIAHLEERLRTRFEWGVPVDIGAPDFELRIAILRRKAYEQNIVVPPDVLEYIANKVTSNVRTMEGQLNRVILYSRVRGKNEQATVELAKEALSDYVEEGEEQAINKDTIINAVIKYFNVKKEDLLGKKRNKEIVEPRWICIYLIHELLSLPLIGIGQIFGKDHTSIMHARDRIIELKSTPKIKVALDDLTAIITKQEN